MKTKAKVLALALVALATACSTPKVLIDQSFRGDRAAVSKVMIMKNGSSLGSMQNKVELFDTYVRMCSIASNKESQCKDTMVLSNVIPKSLY